MDTRHKIERMGRVSRGAGKNRLTLVVLSSPLPESMGTNSRECGNVGSM